jgi:CheY-like chemotaxis protein
MMNNSNAPRKKILIIEDDEINRKVMEFQLKNNFLVDLAKNGKEGLDLFTKGDYDLILMDINLGLGENGIEVMEEIRKFHKGKSTPVIAITAYANFGNRDGFLEAGFDNYIAKPYQADELIMCIMDSINIY